MFNQDIVSAEWWCTIWLKAELLHFYMCLINCGCLSEGCGWWWLCNRSDCLCLCAFVPHCCVCGSMTTVGCIVVGQGIVCLIHWGAISDNTEPAFFLPITRGWDCPPLATARLLWPHWSRPSSTPTLIFFHWQNVMDFIASRPNLDSVSSLWLLLSSLPDVLDISAVFIS